MIKESYEMNTEIMKLKDIINELKLQEIKSKEELQRKISELEALITTTSLQSTSESIHLQEIIKERERALESINNKLAEITRQYEDAVRKITDLQNEIKEKDLKLRQIQSLTANENELKRQIIKLQEEMKEKDERLVSYDNEGQILAKKQGELEKTLRKNRNELKEKDNEILKLKESKEQLIKAIEEMQEVMKRNEGEVNNVSKSLNAMQAVSQASSEKLSKLEAEIASKTDELMVQRRALETAWAEINDYKRSLAEMRAERDEAKKRLGEGASRVMETESTRKDMEQREAVLKATNKQLQDSLQRQMQESNIREERLREEVYEMRKRWQEAITGREALASEVSSATAPLLRQIATLQENMRIKSEHWQNLESNLSERVMRAESATEAAEHRKTMLEEHLSELKLQLNSMTNRFHELQEQHILLQTTCDRLKRVETDLKEKLNELENKLNYELSQRQSVQASARDLENRYRLEIQEAKQLTEHTIKQSDLKVMQLKSELESVREELALEKKKKNTQKNSKNNQQQQQQPYGVSMTSSEATIDLDHNKLKLYPVIPDALPSKNIIIISSIKKHGDACDSLNSYDSLSLI